MILVFIFISIISLFVGSFFNVLIDRIYRGEQFVSGNSYCEACHKKLGPPDLIPVLSYLFLLGRCRYCKARISIWLPIVEIATSVCFTYVFYYLINYTNFLFDPFGGLMMLLFAYIVAGCGILLFFTDAKYYVIPTIYLYIVAAAYIIYTFYLYLYNYASFEMWVLPYSSHLSGMLVMLVFFGFLFLFSRGKMMGEGDIYLAALIGLMLGMDLSVVMWFFSFFIGALFSVGLIIFKGFTVKSVVPFGPFLILGAVVAYFWGTNLINYYFNLL